MNCVSLYFHLISKIYSSYTLMMKITNSVSPFHIHLKTWLQFNWSKGQLFILCYCVLYKVQCHDCHCLPMSFHLSGEWYTKSKTSIEINPLISIFELAILIEISSSHTKTVISSFKIFVNYTSMTSLYSCLPFCLFHTTVYLALSWTTTSSER